MAEPREDAFYRVKLITYDGHEVPVLLQDANGPCPLLAIANVLSLRGDIRIPAGPGRIPAVRRVSRDRVQPRGRSPRLDSPRQGAQARVAIAP